MHGCQWAGAAFGASSSSPKSLFAPTVCESRVAVSLRKMLPCAACADPAVPSLQNLSAAGLRRSFRLSRKDRQGSSGDDSDLGDPNFLTYEEVTRYQQRPHERPRLVVLIGEALALLLLRQQRHLVVQNRNCNCFDNPFCFSFTLWLNSAIAEGSLGARINELKQRVIAENPHHFAVAVPRK